MALADRVESALVGLVALGLASRLVSSELVAEAALLLILCALTFACDTLKPASGASDWTTPCSFRPNASRGLALGCISPALLLGALVLVRKQHGMLIAPLEVHLLAAVACAAQPLTLLLAQGEPLGRSHMPGFALALSFAAPTIFAAGLQGAAFVLLAQLLFVPLLRAGLTRVQCCFTLGEACALAQAGALLLTDSVSLTACALRPAIAEGAEGAMCTPRGDVVVASEAVLSGGLVLSLLLASLFGGRGTAAADWRRGALFGTCAGLCTCGVLVPWLGLLLGRNPVAWAFGFALAPGRPQMVCYWLVALPGGATLASCLAPRGEQLRHAAADEAAPADDHDDEELATSKAKRRRARLLLTRKVYHALALALFVPAAAWQLPLLQLGLAAATALFLLLEVLRACEVAPLAAPLSAFLARFLDSRDGGTLVLTHLYLLLGCALPLWLSDAMMPTPSAAAPPREARAAAGSSQGVALGAAPYAGLVVLGMGDAVASVVGVHLGRVRWPSTRKTVEGSAAAVASMLGLILFVRWLVEGGAAADVADWCRAAMCTVLVCLLEAFTSQIDNLFLPIYYAAALLCVSL